MTVIKNITFSWDMVLCTVVEIDQCFAELPLLLSSRWRKLSFSKIKENFYKG